MKKPSTGKRSDNNIGRRPDGRLCLTSVWLLAAIITMTGLACFFALDIWLSAGLLPLAVPLASFAVPLLLAALIGWQGWRVRSYQHGKKSLNVLEASRIFLLAQAGSRAGAVLLGIALGSIMAYAHIGATSFLAEQMFHVALAGVGAFVLIVTAYIAERWCIVSGDDSSSHAAQKRSDREPAAAKVSSQ